MDSHWEGKKKGGELSNIIEIDETPDAFLCPELNMGGQLPLTVP